MTDSGDHQADARAIRAAARAYLAELKRGSAARRSALAEQLRARPNANALRRAPPYAGGGLDSASVVGPRVDGAALLKRAQSAATASLDDDHDGAPEIGRLKSAVEDILSANGVARDPLDDDPPGGAFAADDELFADNVTPFPPAVAARDGYDDASAEIGVDAPRTMDDFPDVEDAPDLDDDPVLASVDDGASDEDPPENVALGDGARARFAAAAEADVDGDQASWVRLRAFVAADAGFEKIGGIGPGLQLRLQDAGVYSIADLARADLDDLRRKLGAAGRLANLEAWRAKALALTKDAG